MAGKGGIKVQLDIIGGGLSGLATAIAAKKTNPKLSVIVHEKHGDIGFNSDARKCGEAHAIESFSLQWTPSKNEIGSEIHCVQSDIGRKRYTYHRKENTAWILNRPAFIANLGRTAEKHNVVLQTNDMVKDVDSLSGDYIVDASGCPSIIRKKLHLPLRFVGFGYQETLKDCSAFNEHTMKMIFNTLGGYYWIFPRNKDRREVNVGVGLYEKKSLNYKDILAKFKRDFNIEGSLVHRTAGLIPFGLQYPLRKENVLFVGDAGVGTFALDGQGIYRALISGEAAGRFLGKNNPSGYVSEIFKSFIKWDIIGKTFLRSLYVTNRINSKAVLPLWNVMLAIHEFFSLFQSEYTKMEQMVRKDKRL